MTQGKNEVFECPDWYPLIRSARYLATQPWHLLPDKIANKVHRTTWLLWTQIAEAAELEARNEAQQEAQRQAEARAKQAGSRRRRR